MADVMKDINDPQYIEVHQQHGSEADIPTNAPLIDQDNAAGNLSTQIKSEATNDLIENNETDENEKNILSNTETKEKKEEQKGPIGNIDVQEPKENLDSVDKSINESDIFDTSKEVHYSSDEVSDSNSDSSTDSDSDSDSEDSSSEDDDSGSEEDEEDEGIEETGQNDDLIEADDTEGGPIRSKNEIVDEKAPSLPENFAIPETTPITYVGDITALVENSIVVKAKTSGEFKVLSEGTIFCLEDRTPLGPLYEVFGRLQSPVYTVKFNSEDSFDKFKDKKGSRVFYVNPTAEFLLTERIRAIKGTDASNCNDEELPEEEQEFSDDEKESAAKKVKKRKRNKKDDSNDNKKVKQENNRPASLPASVKGRLTSLPTVKGRLTSLPSVKGRLTSLPPAKTAKQVQTSNNIQQPAITNVPQVPTSNNIQQHATTNAPQVNPMQFMQQFMGMINQQSQNLPVQTQPQQRNFSYQEQSYQQQPFYQPQQQPQQQQQNRPYQQQTYQQTHQQQQTQQPQQSYNSYQSPATPQSDSIHAMQNILLNMQPQNKQAEYRQQILQDSAVNPQQNKNYQQQYNYQQPNACQLEPPKQMQSLDYQYQNQNQFSYQGTGEQPAMQQTTNPQNPAIMLAQLTSMLAKQAQTTATSLQQNLQNYPDVNQNNNSSKDDNDADDDYDPANI